MLDRSKALLWDVQHAIHDVQVFLKGVDEETYVASPLLCAAVERKLQIVGEACMQLSKAAPQTASAIPSLRQIVGFRNVLVHGYAVVESTTVYEIATQRLPELEAVVGQLLLDKD